jgi:sulfhydrogenase subunit beta (sulfur reductase)
MGDTGFIAKGKWPEFLERLNKGAALYVPCLEGDTVLFRAYGPDCQPCFDRPANSSPKSIIYPQCERLFSFNFKKESENPQKTLIELDPNFDAPKCIILGARPCDAKGFRIFDRVFLDIDTPDPYYKARRENTTVVTFTCPAPFTGCFCTAVGGGPADREGSDVLVTELEKGYYMLPLTEKGKAILADSAVEDGTTYTAQAQQVQESAHKAVRNPFGTEGGPAIAVDAFDRDEYWSEALNKCVSCGACTFLCPTCYCFNITDEQAIDSGERIRSWDACMFHHFTLETSGHNPRTKKEQRFRNRVGHKFLWYPENYEGTIACCGCGRCIRYCPVSVDISEIVSSLTKSRADVQKILTKDGGNDK